MAGDKHGLLLLPPVALALLLLLLLFHPTPGTPQSVGQDVWFNPAAQLLAGNQ